MGKIGFWLLTAVFGLSPTWAAAQQWYHVELIVFEHLATFSNERWPLVQSAETGPLDWNVPSTRIQPAQAEHLIPQAQRLRNAADYRLHAHLSWQQPILANRQAQAVALRDAAGRIAGQARLYRGTYLHAELEVWLIDSAALMMGQAAMDMPDPTAHLSPVLQGALGTAQPRLQESRRIRANQVHYFDHPKIGVLLQLKPIATPGSAIDPQRAPETFSLPDIDE